MAVVRGLKWILFSRHPLMAVVRLWRKVTETMRCPYCHEEVRATDYAAHELQHRKLRDDGQQSDYMTLPPEDRVMGFLDGVPRVYMHTKCKSLTEMPDDIVRSYLRNPYLHLADRTFCCGCSRHVPWRQCIWVETGEDLQTYMDRLRAGKPELQPGALRRLYVGLWKLLN
jgi:hypothetical protein